MAKLTRVQQVEKVIEAFDFGQLHRVMDYLYGTRDDPVDPVRTARKLLTEVSRCKPGTSIGTGTLIANKLDDGLELLFVPISARAYA